MSFELTFKPAHKQWRHEQKESKCRGN
jgi:hypothetical protein